MATADWAIAPLDAALHDRNDFDCGQLELNRFLKERARKHGEQNISRTFVVVRPSAPAAIRGYYTLALGQIERDDLADAGRRLPHHPVPVVILGRLARDLRERGTGLGRLLLQDAFARCVGIDAHAAVYGIVADPIDNAAVRFYRDRDFEEIGPDVPGELRRMLISIYKVRRLLVP